MASKPDLTEIRHVSGSGDAANCFFPLVHSPIS